jgi:hypothetical protein
MSEIAVLSSFCWLSQAVSKDGKHADHLIITLQVLESSLGSLESLLAMKSGCNDGPEKVQKPPQHKNPPAADGKVTLSALGVLYQLTFHRHAWD